MNVSLKPFDFAQAVARAGLTPTGQPLATGKAVEGSGFQQSLGKALPEGLLAENPEEVHLGGANLRKQIENILLHGVREFRIEHHVSGKSYREGRVTWRTGGHEAITERVREGLIHRLSDLFRREPESPAHRLLRDRTLSDELLVNFFSYVLEIPPLEKQTLLQAVSIQQRAERLRDVIDFHLEEKRLTLKGPGSDRFH